MQDSNSSPSLNGRDKKIVRFQKIKKPGNDNKGHPPFIDLPRATKIMTAALIVSYAALWLGGMMWGDVFINDVCTKFGFVPAKWTGGSPFDVFALFSLITVNFLHGGWTHLAMNGLSFIAFAAGIEKRIGEKNMLILFFVTSAIAVLTHMAFNPSSMQPVIGASGGISGLFGAVLIMMKHDSRLNGSNQKILPMAMIWIVITIGFGIAGGPGGATIAWIAHIGGFLAGMGLCTILIKKT